MAGLLAGRVLEDFRRKEGIPSPHFYPLIIFLNFNLMLLILYPRQWDSYTGLILLMGFFFLQVSGVIILKVMNKNEGFWERTQGRKKLYFSIFPLLVLWVLCLPWDWWNLLGHQTVYNWFFFAWTVWLFHFGIPNISRTPSPKPSSLLGGVGKKIFLYGFTFLFIAYVVIDPYFRFDLTHHSFYLGPLADMSAGKTLLVNINAQYGVIVFYFLNLIFHLLPLGFMSFTLVGFILIILQYLVFYFIVRQLFRSEALAYFCLLALLLINHFCPQQDLPGYYPSTGPLRFGFIYLLTGLVVLRNRKPTWERPIFLMEAAVTAVAFFWSFEVCVYTVIAYVGLVFYESAEFENERIGLKTVPLSRRLSTLLGLTALVGGLLYLYTFQRAHEWPNWSYYWDYLSTYRNGLGMLPTPGFGGWWVIIGVLYFSVFALLGFFFLSSKEKKTVDLNVAVLLTFYGITQFLYFLGRSHYINLFHIAMPSLLVLVFWLYYLRSWAPSEVPKGVQKGFFTLVVVLGGLGLSQTLPIAVGILEKRIIPLPKLLNRLYLTARDLPRDNDFALNAARLMKKYSGDQKSLVYFFGKKDLEVSLYAGKMETYPYNDVIQADAIPSVSRRIMAFDPLLKTGDYIYLSEDLNQVYYEYDYSGVSRNVKSTLEQKLLLGLIARFDLQLIEEKDGIAVYRVRTKNGKLIDPTGVENDNLSEKTRS